MLVLLRDVMIRMGLVRHGDWLFVHWSGAEALAENVFLLWHCASYNVHPIKKYYYFSPLGLLLHCPKLAEQ